MYGKNVLNKKGRFTLDLDATSVFSDFSDRVVTVHKNLSKGKMIIPQKNCFDLTILDILLHQRTHKALKT